MFRRAELPGCALTASPSTFTMALCFSQAVGTCSPYVSHLAWLAGVVLTGGRTAPRAPWPSLFWWQACVSGVTGAAIEVHESVRACAQCSVRFPLAHTRHPRS